MPANLWDPSPPTSRHDFEIAIICALPLEAEAVTAIFDKRWDSKRYGKTIGDTNTYSTGAIGQHNVVLVHLPNVGKVAAATAAVSLRTSYEGIGLALVVGVCGGVPFGKSSDDEILLGDIVISDGITQYDFGRRFPHGFVRKDHVRDNLPRPNPQVGTFLAMLQVEQNRSLLQEQTLEHLDILQWELGDTATYPGTTEDWLFKPTYRHKHHKPLECLTCGIGMTSVCDTALKLSCQELGCDEKELVFRTRSKSPCGAPIIHFGLVASGDSVMKSSEDRDEVASQDGCIAFEMEGAGVWENFPCLIIKGVCDYADSHKSKRWQAFAAAAAAAATKALLAKWNTARSLRLSSHNHITPRATDTTLIDTARRAAILKSLYASTYRDGKERNPDRVAGTCEWFIAHELFQQWRENSSSSMLLVSADPGCGKSVLAKYLVDSQLPTTESRTTCYFFFKDDFADQRSAISALCCILHQLFEQNETLLSRKIAERFEAGGERLASSFVELWDVLITASQDKNAGEIVCILDAFDECEEQGQSTFTRYLGKLYGTKNNFNLKFLLTSRPYGKIKRGFQPLEIPGLPVIILSGEIETEMSKIAKEIDVYIEARVRSIRGRLKLESSEESLLLQELRRIPNRTYLWAQLTLDLVENDINIDKTRIYEVTSQLPRTLDEAYERILARSSDLEEAKKLLHIVIAAVRPLNLLEMNIALVIRESHRAYKDLNLKSEDRFREYVRDLCGLFITIIDSRIYFLHQTAKEFLVQEGPEGWQNNENNQFKWKSSICTLDSHHILSQICIWHLLFTEFGTNPLKYSQPTSPYLHYYKFLDYSAKNWAYHYRGSCNRGTVATESLLEICGTPRRRQSWFRVYWESTYGKFPQEFTTLQIASYFGLRDLVKILLRTRRDGLNAKDGTYGRSALSWASENGFDDVVKLLLKRNNKCRKLLFVKGAEIDTRDSYGRTPLSYAARKGHVLIVEQLVKLGARVDSTDAIGGTPISYALCNGQQTLIDLMLQSEHRVGSVHDILQPLLFSAAQNGDEATIKLLLESNKVNVNSKDNEGQTPLYWAAQNGHEAIVKILLESGKVNVDSKDNNDQTPLYWAARRSHETIVKLLLDSKPDVNSKDNKGQTPLYWAAQNGHEAIVKMLLESGKVNVDSKDNDHQTPLYWAARRGHETIVKLLLDSKPDVDSKDNEGRTPLFWAALLGYEAIVKLLLDSKAYANSKDYTNRTPLVYAARNGHETIVRLLLDSKADVNSKDHNGRTPVSYAAENGYETIVKLLLDSKADAISQDNYGRTPLTYTARLSRLSVFP